MNKSLKPLSKQINTGIKKIPSQPQTILHRLVCLSCTSFLIAVSSPFVPNSQLPTPNSTSSRVLAQTNDARRAEADRLLKQGLEQSQTGQFQAALQSWQQALNIYREIKDRLREGAALLAISRAWDGIGNYPKAIEYSLQSLKIFQEIKDIRGESIALGILGLAYFRIGEYQKAINYHLQNLKIAREMKDPLGEGSAIGNLGITYLAMGDYPKAIEYQLERLKIARKTKDRQGEGSALGNLGIAYLYLGDYPKAIEFHLQRLNIAREIKDRQGEANALGNLGITYRNLGDYAKAIEFHSQSLKIFQEIKDIRGEGESLGNLGLAYHSMGYYPKAIQYHLQSLKIFQEIKDRRGEGQSLGNLGITYRNLGDYAKAIEYHLQFLKIAREINNRNGESIALSNLGLAYYEQGNLQLAESTLFAAIKVLESLRGGLQDKDKVSIFDTQTHAYRTLQQVLIAQNKIDAALEVAERSRARAFVDLLAAKLTDNAKEQLSNPVNIDQIKQIAKSQNATIVQYSRITDEFKVESTSQWNESELYIWVIKPTGEVTFRKSDLKSLWQKENTDISRLVINSRSSIGARGRGIKVSSTNHTPSPKNNLKRLHSLLIKPIADLLPKNENDKVIFIPQDSLFLVPFPALLDENNKFLIEKHTILTSPAIQVLGLTQRQKQKITGKGALVIGNPAMSPDVIKQYGLISLPGAEKEAIEIGKMLKTEPILTNKATKAEILRKMPNARIIHLATHGLIDDVKNFGVPGAVVLAPSGKDNGLLTSGEILDLKLGAELIVLSACDTGQGKLTGDGVIGLSRSLITAGAPSVIVTLWKIPDASSQVLMTDFYRNLEKNPDKAVALRKAVLNTMKQYPDPVDWAAFTLIGEAI